MTTNEASVIYDAVLSVPGMDDIVKINLSISRKKVLLLGQIIEAGMKTKEAAVIQLLATLPKDTSDEIKLLKEECLEKAGLTVLDAKLKNLSFKE